MSRTKLTLMDIWLFEHIGRSAYLLTKG